MNFFEELTGKRYFFVNYEKFYWNHVMNEPIMPVPEDAEPEFLSYLEGISIQQTKDIEINDSYTLDYFLKTYGDTTLVFCLNGESIYHYKREVLLTNMSEHSVMGFKEKKYIKVYLHYKN
jgi:hypothetical protein